MEMRNALLHILVYTSVLALSNSENLAVPSGRVIMDVRPVLLQGRQGDLQCTFSGRPIAVYWEKGDDYASAGNLITWHKGNIYYHGHEGKFGINNDYSLILHNVTAEDEGKYFCRISNNEGVIIRNETDVTTKIPPSGGYPTIDECRNASTRPCSLEVEQENQTVNLTCRTDGASVGLVSLSWTLGCDHGLRRETMVTRNPGGITENLASTINVPLCDEAYVCVAALNATRIKPQTASVIVSSTLEDTSTSKDSTQKPGNKGKGTHIPAVAVGISLMIIVLIVLAVIIFCYYRRNQNKCRTGGDSDVELVNIDCNQRNLRQGQILYFDIWMLVNLKCETGEGSENYFEKLKKVLAHLKADTVEVPKRNSLYQRLCEWKERCKGNTQEAKLEKAMEKESLQQEFQQMIEARKDATGEVSDDDLSHVCWCLRDSGKTVHVTGDVLPFPDTSKSHQNLENEQNNGETPVSKEIDLLKKWKVEFRRRHCGHPGKSDNDENETLLNTTRNNLLNPAAEFCRVLEDARLDKIAKTLFSIPSKYKRLSEDDIQTLAMDITHRHCLTLGKQFGLTENEINQRNSENPTALFDTVAMLKACRRNTGNYALRCKLRRAAENSNRSAETRDAFIDQESSVIYQPQKQTEVTIEEECREEAVSEILPAKLSNQDVYHAEVVRVAYCILMEDILPFAEALGIDRHQLDRFRPPRNNLNKGTSGILLQGLRTVEEKRPGKIRSHFAEIIQKAGFENAANLLVFDFDISFTELSLKVREVQKRKVPFPWKELNVSREALDRCERGDVWPAMKEWKTRTRTEPYHYRSELAQALKTAGLDDIASNVLSGRGGPKTPNDFVLKKIINDTNGDKLWDLIKSWKSDNTMSKPSSTDGMAKHVKECMALKDLTSVVDIFSKAKLKEKLKMINNLFMEGLCDLSNEYVVLERKD